VSSLNTYNVPHVPHTPPVSHVRVPPKAPTKAPAKAVLSRLERYKGDAKFRRHQAVCAKRSLALQKQVDRERDDDDDSDIGEYDLTDPFVNDDKFEELPPMKLGLRPNEVITTTRTRKRTDRYVPIEQVEQEYEECEECESEYEEESEEEYESEYDPSE